MMHAKERLRGIDGSSTLSTRKSRSGGKSPTLLDCPRVHIQKYEKETERNPFDDKVSLFVHVFCDASSRAVD